jgi:hypothetical protein
MKKIVLVLGLILLVAGAVFAEEAAPQIALQVKNAVDTLAARVNGAMEVSIGPVTLANTGTPSALSRYLIDRINLFAANNAKFNVVRPAHDVSRRITGGTPHGTITGSYALNGAAVDVRLELLALPALINGAANSAIGTARFSVPLSELEKMGVAVFPANDRTAAEVLAKEALFAPLDTAPSNSNEFTIEAWPNSDSFTYYDGEDLTIMLLSNRSCYVKVYHIDVHGKQQMIFPNQQDNNNYMPANTELKIPKDSRFVLGAPYGQETIIAVASVAQFENPDTETLGAVQATAETVRAIISRGLSVRDGRANSATAHTRFTFSILEPGSDSEVLSYEKPDDMREFTRLLRTDILSHGGRFSGNESEGTFSESGLQGNYRVNGGIITFAVKQERNKTTQPSTRGLGAGQGYVFSFDKPNDIRQAVTLVQSGISKSGGVFKGDERTGSFQASGITGEYSITEKVDVTIIEKPRIIPVSMIEKEVKKFFGIK